MVKVIRDANEFDAPATLDRSECMRYSILGPIDDQRTYIARDHEYDATIGYGTREEMIALVEAR